MTGSFVDHSNCEVSNMGGPGIRLISNGLVTKVVNPITANVSFSLLGWYVTGAGVYLDTVPNLTATYILYTFNIFTNNKNT